MRPMPFWSEWEAGSDQAVAFREVLAASADEQSGSRMLVERTREIVPFDGIIVSGLDVEGCRFGTATLLATDLPPTFLETYVGERLIEVDPIGEQIRPGRPVASDDDIDHGSKPRPARLAYLFDYFDIKPRTIFPLWRGSQCYGSLLVTRDKPFNEEERAYLQLIAAPLHASLSVPVIERLNRRLGLTASEIRCLELASQGLTSEAIAKASRHTFETVNSYLKSAARKLGAANRTHAIAEALRRRIIA